MIRFTRLWLCVLCFLVAAGCRKPTEPQNADEKQAALNLQLFGLGYRNYLDSNSRPPRSVDELTTLISSDRPIDFDRYHITWGVDVRAITEPRTVLAYDRAAPEKGGMVLFHDGRVERVSAEAFQQLPKAPPGKRPAERPADATFTPTEYFAEFNKLKEEMGRKYQGKGIGLKGVVQGLGSLGGPPALLVISPGKEHEDVRCILPEGQEFWATISKGQEVTVHGLVREPQMYPILVDCGVASAGPNTGVTITAEELAREFADDGLRAVTKYSDKSFILTGEVVSVTGWASFLGVKLKGTAGAPVECVFSSGLTTKERDKQFVPGAKLKVYAEYAGNGTRLMNCELISK